MYAAHSMLHIPMVIPGYTSYCVVRSKKNRQKSTRAKEGFEGIYP